MTQEPEAGVAGEALIVTGATGGMGVAIVRRLASSGPLLLTDRSADRLGDLVASLPGQGHEVVAGDLADPATIDALRSSSMRVHGLVHAAAISAEAGDPRRIFEVNLLTTVRLLDAVEEYLASNAVAVLIGSVAGHTAAADRDEALDRPLGPGTLERLAEGTNPDSAYEYSKRGVIRLAQRRARSWASRGARIVSLSPGLIDTPMSRSYMSANSILDQVIETIPLGRQGRPEEIAAAVAWLCSPEASYVTGCDLVVDGGLSAPFDEADSTNLRTAG